MGGSFVAKLLKFCVVGGSGVFVDFGVTYVCKEWLKINKYVANSLGFVAAATSNYFLNRWWTFGSKDPRVARQYLLFLAISAVGLALNNLIIWLLNDRAKVGFNRLFGVSATTDAVRVAKVNFYSSKLIAIGCVTVWNFLMNYFFNFN